MDIDKKDQRVPVMMTANEITAIDDWRFARRMASRGEAIRQLITLGLGHRPAANKGESVQPLPAPPEPMAAGWSIPDEISDAVKAHRKDRPWLESDDNAMIDLIRRGLESMEDRDEMVELEEKSLAQVKAFAIGIDIPTIVARMIDYAYLAWRARQADAADEDGERP